MMRHLITIFFLSVIHCACGQDADTTMVEDNFDKFINREFDSLEANNYIQTIEEKYPIKINSLAKCFALATTSVLTQGEWKHLNARIERIAERFYKEGTPILISPAGSSSMTEAIKLNSKENKYNVTYVSFGNYCIVETGEHEFERVFNNRTMKLLGIGSLEK